MKRLDLKVVLLLALIMGVSHAYARSDLQVGTKLMLRPNDVIPETPPGSLWHVTSKVFEKMKTWKMGTETNLTIPVIEVELVNVNPRLVNDLLESPDVGGYLSGSRSNLQYRLKLTPKRHLIAEVYTPIPLPYREIFTVGETLQSVRSEADLPELPDSYAWVRLSPLFVEHVDVATQRTTYILAKVNPSAPDVYKIEYKYKWAARDLEEAQHFSTCISDLNATRSIN